MKIGEIKIEALKLMFVNYDHDISLNDLDILKNDANYGSYLVNMEGSLFRALDRIENACVLPLKSKNISMFDCYNNDGFLEYDLLNLEDYFSIERVIGINKNGEKNTSCDFSIEGNTLVLDDFYLKYKLLYYPKIILKSINDNDELNIPNNIARLIPYFIKSELYQEEEPSVASEARNLFEASLQDLKKQYGKQNYLHRVISFY
ncbi:MAG: hypothetical protein IJW82_07525 [Clostridia bacterium]|nr:hypothetical protein [Clostridia bacterium]